MTATISRPTKKTALIERLNVGTAFLFGFLGALVTYVISSRLITFDEEEMLIHTNHDAIVLLTMVGWWVGFMFGIGALIGPFRWLAGKDLSYDEQMYYAGKDLGMKRYFNLVVNETFLLRSLPIACHS